MRCFITGITGFVGRYLAKHLAEQGAEVFGIYLEGQVDSLPVRAVHCDLLDGEKLTGLLSEFRPGQIYHLAALVNPLESLQAPQSYYLVNVQGTVSLLESLRRNRLETRLLLVSSAEIYGPTGSNVLLTEEAPAAPLNPYASSKMLGEKVSQMYGQCYDISVVIARPFNHTGPGQSETYVVSDFCKQIATMEQRTSQEGERTLRVGNLDSVRDFLDVRDVVSAYTTLAERGEAGQVYNVCSGRGVSIGEILELALQMTELKIHVEVDQDKCRAAEKQFRVGENGKLLALRNWTPRYTLKQTLADTLEAWRVCMAPGVDRA